MADLWGDIHALPLKHRAPFDVDLQIGIGLGGQIRAGVAGAGQFLGHRAPLAVLAPQREVQRILMRKHR